MKKLSLVFKGPKKNGKKKTMSNKPIKQCDISSVILTMKKKKYKLQQNIFTMSKNKDDTFNVYHHYDYSQSGLKMSGSYRVFHIFRDSILQQLKKNTFIMTVHDYLHEDTSLTAVFTFTFSNKATAKLQEFLYK